MRNTEEGKIWLFKCYCMNIQNRNMDEFEYMLANSNWDDIFKNKEGKCGGEIILLTFQSMYFSQVY